MEMLRNRKPSKAGTSDGFTSSYRNFGTNASFHVNFGVLMWSFPSETQTDVCQTLDCLALCWCFFSTRRKTTASPAHTAPRPPFWPTWGQKNLDMFKCWEIVAVRLIL